MPGNTYPAITVPFQTRSCPTVIAPSANGEYELPDVAIGPDCQPAECDCEPVRRGHGDCDAVDGGQLADILLDALQASLPNSGDEEFSCNSRYEVRCIYCWNTAPTTASTVVVWYAAAVVVLC